MTTKKFGKLCPLLLLFSPLAIAKEYQIQRGDTLSQIAQREYPERRIYGKNGTLAELLRKNRKIQNPDLILTASVIHLEKSDIREVAVITPVVEPVMDNEVPESEPELAKKIHDKFFVGLGFGPRFYSQDQSGAQGKTDGQTIFWKNIDFFAGYTRGEFEAVVEFSSYQMDFDSKGGGKNQQLYRLNPKVYYKNLFASFLYEEQPLFQYLSGDTRMSSEALFLPGIGYRLVKNFDSHIETRLEIDGELNYLVSSSSDERAVKIKSASGYGMRVGGNLVRRLNVRMPLYYFWANNFRYRSFERDVSWDGTSGKVESTHMDFSSTLGLRLDF